LASISQNYARRYNTSIDRLEFEYDIKNQIYDENIDVVSLFDEANHEKFQIQNGQDGILLCGFYLDGAKWDRNVGTLLDSPQRFSQLPNLLCKLVKVNIFTSIL
jgi:hypothetical protein